MLTTRGRPTVIPPEDAGDVQVAGAVAINTEKSQVAFLPVTQQDFNNNERSNGARPMPRRGYYAGYPYGPYYNPYYGNDSRVLSWVLPRIFTVG